MSIDYFCFSDFNLPIAEKTNESLLNNYLFKEKIFILYPIEKYDEEFSDMEKLKNFNPSCYFLISLAKKNEVEKTHELIILLKQIYQTHLIIMLDGTII